MNSKNILDAMTNIENDHILSAQRKLGYDPDMQSNTGAFSRTHRTLRRTIALIAAVIMLVSVCFTTALAVSPEFRELIFRFFHIEQEQVIPQTPVATEVSADDMFVEPKISIGDVLEGKYVHTPVSTQAQGGVFLVCTDEVEMKQGSRYDAYCEENGEFIKLEEHTFKQDYTLRGTDFHVEFEWAEHNGNVIITWAEANERFAKSDASGDASAALFMFIFAYDNDSGEYVESRYPVLLNLHTGELTDVLAGTAAQKLDRIENAAISGDRTKMLLCQSTTEGDCLYYVDLTSGQMHSLDELSGERVDSCSLIGNKLACWNLTEGFYKAWNIDLVTFRRTELFDSVCNAVATPEADAGIVFLMGFDSWIRQGNMYAGSSFALEVDEAQNVYVIDLATGVKAPIEGYVWTPETQRIPSPDGRKLLLAGGPPGQDFEYVGVLDFERMSFVEFSRDNSNDVHEYLACWFDENTVVICPESAASAMCSDFYFYSLIGDEGVG